MPSREENLADRIAQRNRLLIAFGEAALRADREGEFGFFEALHEGPCFGEIAREGRVFPHGNALLGTGVEQFAGVHGRDRQKRGLGFFVHQHLTIVVVMRHVDLAAYLFR